MSRDELAVWIRSEAKKRGWPLAEVARRANTNAGALYEIVNGRRDAGFRLCAKIADAFGVPSERVLRIAGLLPSGVAGGEGDEVKQELDDYWAYLSSDEREVITALARVLYEKQAQRRVEDEAGQSE